MQRKNQSYDLNILPILYLEQLAQKQVDAQLKQHRSLHSKPKMKSTSTQSQFFQHAQQNSLKTCETSEFDNIFIQVLQQKLQKQQQSAQKIINLLKREKKQLNNPLELPSPRPQKPRNPLIKPEINFKDRELLQRQLCDYVKQSEANKTYKLSRIHGRRQDIQPFFNFDEFQCLDDICPKELLLKKRFGLKEENMFRNSMGVERIILQRIVRNSLENDAQT